MGEAALFLGLAMDSSITPPIFVANTPVLGTRSLPHVHYEGRWWQRLGYRQPLGARGGSDCGASGHPALSLTLP